MATSESSAVCHSSEDAPPSRSGAQVGLEATSDISHGENNSETLQITLVQSGFQIVDETRSVPNLLVRGILKVQSIYSNNPVVALWKLVASYRTCTTQNHSESSSQPNVASTNAFRYSNHSSKRCFLGISVAHERDTCITSCGYEVLEGASKHKCPAHLH